MLAGPMNRDEMRQAIVRPAQAAALIVERGLTARILDEVEGQPGALPLMSHALLETWRRRKGRALTLEAYEAVGGLQAAVTRTAEAVHGRLTPRRVRGDPDERASRHRRRYATAAGVSAGIDMVLALAGLIAGDDMVQGLQLLIEYAPGAALQRGVPGLRPGRGGRAPVQAVPDRRPPVQRMN